MLGNSVIVVAASSILGLQLLVGVYFQGFGQFTAQLTQ
jgi:hypothetical protein